MNTMTTQEQIESVRLLCNSLPIDLVKAAWVDDWGRFGNFSICVRPLTHDRSTTLRLKAAIAKALPVGSSMEGVYGPDPVREYNRWTKTTKTVGYSRSFWMVDINFQKYHADLNRFDSQLAGVKVDGYPVGLPDESARANAQTAATSR